MKKEIHPKYYQAKVTCACGNTFTVGSTKQELIVDICSNCHPFFTGEERFLDRQGRVEKFVNKQKHAAEIAGVVKAKKVAEKQKEARPQTLKEMLSTKK